MLGVTDLIAGIFKPAAELIDELHTSEDERLKAKGHLLDVQAAAMQRVFDYEKSALESQAMIVNSEASSVHWLTASWRPITMLVMLSLVVGDAMEWLPNPLSEQAFLLLQLGLGGYIAGRSAEKIVQVIKK